MDGWLATISITDNLCTSWSGVFKVVAKTEGYTTYVCQLCGRHEASPETFVEYRNSSSSDGRRKSHAEDPLHKQRAAALLAKREAMMKRLSWSFQHFEALMYYQSPIFDSVLFRHILLESNPTQVIVEQHLKELVLSEPLVLLELALWKSACLQRPPSDGLLRPLEWLEWYKSGWKSRKASARRDPLPSVVVGFVAPFLGLKKKKEDGERQVPSP